MSATSAADQLKEISSAIQSHDLAIERARLAHEFRILPHQLKIGLHCLKAHCLFALNPGKGGRPKKLSTVDSFLTRGFDGWLSECHPALKRSTVYRWINAVQGLGINELSSEEDLDSAFSAYCQTITGRNPSLASLVAAAVERIAPPADPPPNLQQSEFDFIRGHLSSMREEIESVVHIKDRLRLIPDAHKAACARLYAALYELTGTWWAPSNDPDDLASVNPDAITI